MAEQLAFTANYDSKMKANLAAAGYRRQGYRVTVVKAGKYTYEVRAYQWAKNPGKMIPLKGISIKGRNVHFYANPGVLKKYKKKLTALAKRLVK